MMDPLYVVSALFNPWRYRSRKALYDQFQQRTLCTEDARLYVGELAFGDRPFELTTGHHSELYDGRVTEFQYRTRQELWHKERMLNRLIQELPPDWKYVAWVDADLQFARPDWAQETVHLLQHYDVVQMFSHSQNLSPTYESLKCQAPKTSYVYNYLNGKHPPKGQPVKYNGSFGHPGFAWAFRRDALEHLGGLLDISILGSGDFHMSLALTGDLRDRIPPGYTRGYAEQLELWADRADRHIKKNLGVMPGLVNHYWHGSMKDRRYNERQFILTEERFDPEFDLKNATDGLLQWTDRNPTLHQRVREYFARRNEDDIHVE